MNTLGARLSYLREKKGWTKTYVSKKLGMKTVSTYANWEYDTRQPDNDMIVRLAELFEVPTDYLLGKSNTLNTSTTKADQDEAEFQAFANNPTLQKWYKELPKSKEEDLERLRMMWEILKNNQQK